MNAKVLTSAREMAGRAKADGQTGRLATADELERLAQELAGHLPPWYSELLGTVPLIGLELGFPDPEDSDEISWLLWLAPDGIYSESRELYPGVAVLDHGYLCVAGCSHGSGDQYFLKTPEGDDPPLCRIYHDVGEDPDEIIAEGVIKISLRLSDFFVEAKTKYLP